MSNTSHWTEPRRECLRAFCDTLFPALAIAPDPTGFWKRSASDLGVHLAVADSIENVFAPAAKAGVFRLLDALAGMNFCAAELGVREQLLHSMLQSSPVAAVGIGRLIKMVLSLCYVLPDVNGRNANWDAIGYPGPSLAKQVVGPRAIKPLLIEDDDATLDADVCIVGSGAGGGVIAGELAKRGLSVVVLEAGGYYDTGDFNQLEMWSLRNLYWRGGYQPNQEDSVHIIAGSTLGGGTQINWENCLATPEWVRHEWEREHGLDGLAGPEFESQLNAVTRRLNVNSECVDFNGPHLRFEAGARRLGYHFQRAMRNIDPAKYDADSAGFHGYGDVTGSRQSTVNTYLSDAQAHGARILVRTRAVRITSELGRATGVEAMCVRNDGRRTRVVVRAPTVVAACGALETPGLLLRSGLGGPAVGSYLRLHPCVGITARYSEVQANWWGPPQAAVCDEFIRLHHDHGFLIEGSHHGMGLTAAAAPWRSGQEHKSLMEDSSHFATLISIARDHGWGKVGLDEENQAQVSYRVDDPIDVATLTRSVAELAKVHEAAGADVVRAVGRLRAHEWTRGDNLTEWLTQIEVGHEQPNRLTLFSAHQMGSARMGRDPGTSVAKPTGELHDTRGVWIGDTSAFPSAPGVNPMITCMALAMRTASRIKP
jgi:choline dehydrogenase-like flavoprotein